jgi:hypothetical protein
MQLRGYSATADRRLNRVAPFPWRPCTPAQVTQHAVRHCCPANAQLHSSICPQGMRPTSQAPNFVLKPYLGAVRLGCPPATTPLAPARRLARCAAAALLAFAAAAATCRPAAPLLAAASCLLQPAPRLLIQVAVGAPICCCAGPAALLGFTRRSTCAPSGPAGCRCCCCLLKLVLVVDMDGLAIPAQTEQGTQQVLSQVTHLTWQAPALHVFGTPT